MTPTTHHAPVLLLSFTLANTNISVFPYDYDDPNSLQGDLLDNWMRVGVERSLVKNRERKAVWEEKSQAEEPVEEIRNDGSLENQVCSEHVEQSTCYLLKCPRMERACFSKKEKILFAGWVLYSPNGVPITSRLPMRQDIVYLMLLEDVPKIYLARDSGDRDDTTVVWTTLDVTSPKMRVQMTDVSKSHGRGVVVVSQSDGTVHGGTLVPISLPRCMFHNKNHSSLVDEEEFTDLAHCTIAPFRRTTCRSTPNSEWCHPLYHQEFAPVAQLEAAMHLMFVMDSWMTKMLKL